MNPTISVIIPVYNTVKDLSHCIDSILGQSFTDFELLLIDDGSTDGSGAVCDEYAAKDSRVRVIHKANGGVSSARNMGLDNACGEWVTFIDSDDWIEPGYFDLGPEKTFDLICGQRVFQDGTVDKNMSDGEYRDEDFKNFLVDSAHTNLYRMSIGMFFRKSIIENCKIRFDEKLHFGEDRIFTMEYLSQSKSLKVLPTIRYVYNRHDNWDGKYVIPFRDAEFFMEAFMDVYDRFPVKSSGILPVAGFIVRFVDQTEKNLRLRQALSKPFLRYKKVQLSEKPLPFRIKYYSSKALSVFIHV